MTLNFKDSIMRYSIIIYLVILNLFNTVSLASSGGGSGSNKSDLLALLKSSEKLKESKKALNIVPEERKISGINYNKSKNFKAYGYSIAIPWDHNLKTLRNDVVSVIYSTSKFAVSLGNPVNEDWMSGFEEDIKKNDLLDYIPNEILSKDKYHIVTNALNSTYKDFIQEPYLDTAAKKYFLLNIKFLFVAGSSRLIESPQPIYAFQISSLRGYQVGRIEKMNFIEIYAFTQDNVQLKIDITRDPENSGFVMTQDHVDFIIKSIKKIDSKDI